LMPAARAWGARGSPPGRCEGTCTRPTAPPRRRLRSGLSRSPGSKR
jgi:hypothetical protein